MRCSYQINGLSDFTFVGSYDRMMLIFIFIPDGIRKKQALFGKKEQHFRSPIKWNKLYFSAHSILTDLRDRGPREHLFVVETMVICKTYICPFQ